MDFKDFEELYRSDGVVFHLAWEIFMEKGRNAILAMPDQKLAAMVAHRITSLFVTEKIVKMANVVKDFAGLNSMELLSCVNRCGIRLEDDPLDQPGVCPLCGGKLIHGEDASGSRPHAIGWTCKDCGATGKEAYREVFDCHYDVLDSGGELVVERNRRRK